MDRGAGAGCRVRGSRTARHTPPKIQGASMKRSALSRSG